LFSSCWRQETKQNQHLSGEVAWDQSFHQAAADFTGGTMGSKVHKAWREQSAGEPCRFDDVCWQRRTKQKPFAQPQRLVGNSIRV